MFHLHHNLQQGYVFFVGVGAVSWNCKRQPTIAFSTTEAEYMATSQCTKEAIWLRKLMADVGLVQDGATTIMCDNQGCIALAKNPTHHSRTKHIDIQHHFIQEKLESGEIGLKYCPTQDMVADVLTKALAKERHQNLTRSMGLGVLDYLQSGSVEDCDVDVRNIDNSVVDIRNNVVDKCCKQSKT